MTTITVSNASQLSTALQSAKGGDVIQLAGGSYGDFYVSSKLFASDITIKSMDPSNPATFNTLTVKASSNINFQDLNVDFTPTATTLSFSSAVMIDKSSGISFSGGVIEGGNAVSGVPITATEVDSTGNVIGMPTARGMSIQGSTDVTVEGTDISHFLRGIVIGGSDGVTIRDNEIHHLRKSAIVGNADNLLIEGNYLHSSNPWRIGEPGGDHADFIALWTDSRQTEATENITIRDNVLSQGDGARILGLWLQGGEDGYKNVIIEGNAILGGDHQGIMMSNTTGGRVTDNVLLQTTSYDKAPAILLLEGASGFTVDGNIAYSIADKNFGTTGNVITDDNTLAQKTSSLKAGYYDSTLINKILGLQDADAIYALADLGITDTVVSVPIVETSPVVVAPPVVTSPTPIPAPTPAPAPLPTTGDQTLIGNSSANTLTGGVGNDTLDGRGGTDTLVGGKGNDTYIVPNSSAVIVEKAGEGTDTVIAKGNYVLGANLENLVVSDASTNSWSGTGNTLNNVITGNAGNNVLNGLAGNDTINGGLGNDVLIGGAGADNLTGGAGADKFTFAKGSGADIISDFSAGDSVDVSAFLKMGLKATVKDTGDNTVISFSSGDSITLVGVDASHLKASDAGFVYS